MALNFPDPSASPWIGDNGVMYTWVEVAGGEGYWSGSSEKLDESLPALFVERAGDSMSGDLTVGTDIKLEASTGKITSASTTNSDANNTVVTKDYLASSAYWSESSGALQPVDTNNKVIVGGDKITLNTDGSAAYSAKITSANTVAGDSSSTLTTKGYVDTSVNAVPTAGDGTITIVQPGTSNQTFTVNQSGNKTITLKNDNTQNTPGDGTITIVQPGTGNQTFSVNQGGNKTITLKNDNTQVTPGNGQITIVQPGTSNQTFSVNQTGNTQITLKNDNTQNTPGDGTITIVQPGTSNQTFSVNQSGNTQITLKNDNTQNTVNNGQINVSAGTGLSVTGSNATANQAGNTTRTLSLNTTYTDERYAQKNQMLQTLVYTYAGQFSPAGGNTGFRGVFHDHPTVDLGSSWVNFSSDWKRPIEQGAKIALPFHSRTTSRVTINDYAYSEMNKVNLQIIYQGAVGTYTTTYYYPIDEYGQLIGEGIAPTEIANETIVESGQKLLKSATRLSIDINNYKTRYVAHSTLPVGITDIEDDVSGFSTSGVFETSTVEGASWDGSAWVVPADPAE